MADSLAKCRLISALLEVEQVGPAKALDAVQWLPTLPQDPDELSAAICEIGPKLKREFVVSPSAARMAFDAADSMLEECARMEIRVAVPGAGPFDPSVWRIPKPPARLFYRGTRLDACDQPGVAVIGTRDPSDFGAKSATRIARRCVEQHLTVVSGLAIGCDTAAHRGAVEAGGFTIAVLAHGLHTVYPASNRGLASEILDLGGMLVSEYPPNVELRPNQLVERDRLQAGLSRGVIVIETDVEGGTMHTVKFARDQGRLLGCLNHPEEHRNHSKCRGNQKLISEGKAQPLGTPDELRAFLESVSQPDAPASPVVAAVAAEPPQSLFGDVDVPKPKKSRRKK